MHINNIVHRDLKPENVVMSNVILEVLREYVKYVISDGLQYARIEGKHIAEL